MTVTPIMPERRCKTGDITMSDAMPFAQHFEVRTTFPLKECLGDRFLMDARGMMKAGDRVSMVRYTSDEWTEVTEVLEGLRVRFVDQLGVSLLKTSEIIYSGAPSDPGITVSRGFKGRFVVRLEGAVIKDFNTLVEADEFAAAMANETGRPVSLYRDKKAV